MRYFLIGLPLAAFIGFIIHINISYRKHRAAMTPEERKREDEEEIQERRLW